MEIRAFDRQDTERVVELWKACGLVVPWNDPGRDIERKLLVQPELFLVGLQEGSLVASVMAGFEGHRGWINYLAVHPSMRKRGCGRAMMRRAEELLSEMGCPKVNLQVRRGNKRVLGFYRAIGYVEDDVVSLGRRLIEDR